MTKWLEEKGLGRAKVNYKLRDSGLLPPSATAGEPHPLSSTARSAAGCPWTRRTCRSCYPTSRATSPRITARARSRICATGCSAPAEVRRPGRARDGHHAELGRQLLSTSCATWTRTTTRPSRAGRPWATGARSTGTTAAWSTRRSTCSTAASGTSSSTTSASCRPRSPMPSARATA